MRVEKVFKSKIIKEHGKNLIVTIIEKEGKKSTLIGDFGYLQTINLYNLSTGHPYGKYQIIEVTTIQNAKGNLLKGE